ncbi:hypothetical protein LSAT2_007594 [Lamellibrachia satsuma]|nr:hypothetical protein LSAT2_007594 [Lamellibrachia satsuma]
MDFAKAFDKVPHHRLIQKLERYGITGPVNTWVEKFLKDRKQRVACESMHSDWAPVISGVPEDGTMKSSLAVLSAVLLLWVEAVQGLNIQEIVEQRQDLTKLAKFMRNLPVMREFSKLGAKKYTFFAPSNIAFENIPSHVSQHFQLANAAVLKERDDIMRYQTVLGVVNTDKMLKNEMLHSYGPDSNLFIFVVNGVSRIARVFAVRL